MSVAVVQGCSGALGSALTRHILKNTSLKVYGLTHRADVEELRGRLGGSNHGDRLTILEGVDLKGEDGLERASKTINEREGKNVRLVACLAGILHPEKSLGAISHQDALDTFRINTLGHLLAYKHFVPLIPTKKAFEKLKEGWSNGEADPAQGLVGQNSLCFSLSARVGSIGDNNRGGWYSYRAAELGLDLSSKAALNQVIRTLDHELVNKSSSAVAVGYHPGTVLTSFTRPVIGDKPADPAKGLFEVEDAIGHMTKLMSRVRRDESDWGGRCYDWKEEVVEW